jgi:hypothetical protein
MSIEDAKVKIIQYHEDGSTIKIILLIIQFGTELLRFLTEYLKTKNDEKNSAKH